ncbi:MAG: methyltransferase family protein [Methylomicrobium sp.]
MYRPWPLWFIDYYWLAFTLAGPLYFYGQRGQYLLNNDKYQALLAFMLRGALHRWGLLKVTWSPLVRLGLLSVLLKLFFMPYMVSWGFQNINDVWSTVKTSTWDFHAITIFLIQLCLFVDVTVYGFGYLVESRRLGSEIRSVDPHWLGWLVCLCCYPPFNNFTFLPFDVQLFPIQFETTQSIKLFFNGVEVLLWAVFAWASLTLGFKASNLTARGTIRRGPYRWVRHPAYTAKLGVWWIQGIIFGDYSVGILLAFTVIYGLRAWTEERHLLAVDADYADYSQMVRWRFFPRIL